MIIKHDKVRFIPGAQGCFNIQRPIDGIHNINRIKNENHMIISIDAEKASEKNPTTIMIKTLNKVSTEGPHMHAQSCLILGDTIDCRLPSSSVHGIF